MAEDAQEYDVVASTEISVSDPEGDWISLMVYEGNISDPSTWNPSSAFYAYEDLGYAKVEVMTSGILDYETAPSVSLILEAMDMENATTMGITVNVTDVAEAPVFSAPSGPKWEFSVPEDAATGDTVPTPGLTVSDPQGDWVTLTLYEGDINDPSTWTTNYDFYAYEDLGEVVIEVSSGTLDYETTPTYDLILEGMDMENSTAIEVKINVTDVAEDPYFTSTGPYPTIAEDAPPETIVGLLGADDPQGWLDISSYAIVSGNIGNAFKMTTTGSIRVNSSLDFETRSSYTLGVEVYDYDGNVGAANVTIYVSNVNEAPYGISLSPSSVIEHSPVGTVVGSLAAVDDDAGDSHTFSLVPGEADNAQFSTSPSGQLLTASEFDYESGTTSYSVVVDVQDSGLLSYRETLTVTVTDANDPPDDITLSNAEVDENELIGTVVGTFTTSDINAGDSHTYSLVPGFGDNSDFTVTGNTLSTAATFNYESSNSYSIKVRTTDNGTPSQSFEKTFTVSINDVNDAPRLIGGPYGTSADRLLIGFHLEKDDVLDIGSVIGFDEDAGQALTYSLAGDPDGIFSINSANGEITLSNDITTATQLTYDLTLTVTDDGTPSLSDSDPVFLKIVPAVGVAGDAFAVEGTGDNARIDFIRFAPDASGDLTVDFVNVWKEALPLDLDNTGAWQQDWQDLISQQIVIPDGEWKVSLDLSAVDDSGNSGEPEPEGIQTFLVRITDASDESYVKANGSTLLDGTDARKAVSEMKVSLLDGVTLFAIGDDDTPLVDANSDGLDDASGNPGIHISDVRQGLTGDCFLLAAMNALVLEKWEEIESRFTDNGGGNYTVSLYSPNSLLPDILPGGWIDYSVTMDLSRGPGSARLTGDTDAQGHAEVWPILLEKAFAMREGGYAQINGGNSGEAWVALTGTTYEWVSFGGMSAIEMLQEIANATGAGKQVIGATHDDLSIAPVLSPKVVEDHAYTVTGFQTIGGVTHVNLCNPHGENDAVIPYTMLGQFLSGVFVLSDLP